MATRMIEELGLNEEQAAKFKAAFEEGQKATQEAMKARDAKIKEFLTEEQAKKFDELARQRPGQAGQRGQDGQPGRRGQGGGQGGDARGAEGDQPRDPFDALRQMVKKLDLNDEQKEKARAVLMEMQGRIGEVLREAREGGGDRESLRAKMEQLRQEVAEKLKPILTPEQAAQLDEMAKKTGRRMLDGAGPRPGGEGGPMPPEEIAKRKLNAIRDDLKVIPEVWAVLGEKIGAILKKDAEFKSKGQENGKRCRELMEKGATDEEIKNEIKAWREAKAAHEAELKKMREDLRELLDLKEEAKLILHGVLD
jgi:protein CpxP